MVQLGFNVPLDTVAGRFGDDLPSHSLVWYTSKTKCKLYNQVTIQKPTQQLMKT